MAAGAEAGQGLAGLQDVVGRPAALRPTPRRRRLPPPHGRIPPRRPLLLKLRLVELGMMGMQAGGRLTGSRLHCRYCALGRVALHQHGVRPASSRQAGQSPHKPSKLQTPHPTPFFAPPAP